MAVPQGRKSKARKRTRRAQHDKMEMPHVVICDNCGADVLSHRICPECGWYKDRIVVEPEEVEDEELYEE